MLLSVLTPDRTIFSGAVTKVALPGTDGNFQLLDNHAPLVSSLEGGRVTLVTASGEYRFYDNDTDSMSTGSDANRSLTFSIDRGFVEVLNNEVNLLVQGARNLH